MELTEIRPYRREDREAVFRVAADTAFFGEPVEYIMEDRRLFCDGFYAYYTDFEPEHGWVATVNGVVAGFLMGCWDTKKRDRAVIRYLLPEVVGKAITGRYRIGKLTWSYIWGVFKQSLQGIYNRKPHPLDLNLFPAHLHVNLDSGYRGHGLGRRLMEAYLEQLRANKIPGVHLKTTNLNEAACKLYESMGFSLLSAYPEEIFNYVLGHRIEGRVYVMRLDE